MRFSFLIFLLLMALTDKAATIVVSPKGPLSSIRKAIKIAKPGDTILIKYGMYYVNNALVTKPLTIIGENYPILHGADKYEIMTITSSNVKVSGIHFTNSGYSSMNDLAAVTITSARNVVIENNKLMHTFFGVHVANSRNFIIRNNIMRGVTRTEQTSGNGIHLWKCDNATVENNDAAGHRDGIYFEFVTNSQIRGNNSHNNIRYGLHFMFSNDDVYSGNTFRQNGAGVSVMFSKRVHMIENNFVNNWGPSAYGILLKEINDSEIIGNTFQENTAAIYMEGANRIVVTKNVFRENGWAAKVQASCSDNKFNANNFLSNTFDVATNGSLVLNDFSGNYWDKYDGYDINRDGIGDVPYHPVSMYSMLIEQNSNSLMLLRSFIVTLLERAERAIPSLTPENLRDDKPLMKRIKL